MKINSLLYLSTFSVLLSCEKSSDSTTEVKTNTFESFTVIDSTVIKVDNSVTQALLDLFLQKKLGIKEKLDTTTDEEGNLLYESYIKENQALLEDINKSEEVFLNHYYEGNSDRVEKLRNKLEGLGLEFYEAGEGYVEITTNADFYNAIFGNHVSDDYDVFIFNRAEEVRKRDSVDENNRIKIS